jgi:hypothetical protein
VERLTHAYFTLKRMWNPPSFVVQKIPISSSSTDLDAHLPGGWLRAPPDLAMAVLDVLDLVGQEEDASESRAAPSEQAWSHGG